MRMFSPYVGGEQFDPRQGHDGPPVEEEEYA
jgi:hypothetical protein